MLVIKIILDYMYIASAFTSTSWLLVASFSPAAATSSQLVQNETLTILHDCTIKTKADDHVKKKNELDKGRIRTCAPEGN